MRSLNTIVALALFAAAGFVRAEVTNPPPVAIFAESAEAKIVRLTVERDMWHGRFTNLAQTTRSVVSELKKQNTELQQTVDSLRERIAATEAMLAPLPAGGLVVQKPSPAATNELKPSVAVANAPSTPDKPSLAVTNESLVAQPAALVATNPLPVVEPPAPEKPLPTATDDFMFPEQPAPMLTGDSPREDLAGLIDQAQRAFGSGDFVTARDRYTAVYRLNPTNAFVLGNLATIELQLGDTDAAETHLRQAITLKPDDAFSLCALGNLYFRKGQYDAALDVLIHAAALSPNDAQVQNFLGMTFCQKGQRAAGEAALRKAIQIDPHYNTAHHNLAVFYATAEPPQAELARWHYDQALTNGQPHNLELEKLLEAANRK